MEYIGLFCLVLLIFYSSYPAKVIRLEHKVRKLESKQKGDLFMSKMINEAISKQCKFTHEDDSQDAWIYTILDADDERVKVSYTDKKAVFKTEIIRIDSIKKVCLMSE